MRSGRLERSGLDAGGQVEVRHAEVSRCRLLHQEIPGIRHLLH
jgi:hypothetical protein